jgi:hypothetical protein
MKHFNTLNLNKYLIGIRVLFFIYLITTGPIFLSVRKKIRFVCIYVYTQTYRKSAITSCKGQGNLRPYERVS